MKNFDKFHNNTSISKSFSPDGGKFSLKNEQEAALAFAKQLHNQHIEKLKDSNSYKKAIKESQEQKDLDKKYEEQRKQYFEKVKNLSNKEIQKSIEIAKTQNEKFKEKFNQDSSIDDLFNTLSDDLKNYQK